MAESPITFDEQGPIRYDWPSIKLLYVGGASHSDIAHGMCAGREDQFDRVRAAIAQASSRDDWPSLRQDSLMLVQSNGNGSPNNDSTLSRVSSHIITQSASNTRSVRKERYLNSTSAFIDRASEQLDKRTVSSLEDAALSAKLFEPVHALARDIHGLNAKDGSNAVQVNILSDWAGGGPPAVEVETRDTTTRQPTDSA